MDAHLQVGPARGLRVEGILHVGLKCLQLSACTVGIPLEIVTPPEKLIQLNKAGCANQTNRRFWGSKELQEKYSPRLCSGSVSSFCLSEVGAGSDAFSLSTRATLSPDGSYYTIEVRHVGWCWCWWCCW